MKGSKCKCGFATTSIRTKCPRCGREMKPSEWKERGRVLSIVELQVIPEGLDAPFNMVLVGIGDRGPKIICWTSEELKENDEVVVGGSEGRYLCSPAPKVDNQSS